MPQNSINVWKRRNESWIIPKFSTVLLFGLIWSCKKLRWEKAVYVCRFAHGGDTFPLRTTSLLEGSSGLQEAYTIACPNSAQKITATCWCHVLTPCQVSWFSAVFWNYRNSKAKFLNLPGWATTPGCLNFTPIPCMGPRNSPKDTHVIFQTTLVHWSLCL